MAVINDLPFLGTIAGNQYLDDQGYYRVYRSFLSVDQLRNVLAAEGNRHGPDGFIKKGEGYSGPATIRDVGGGFFKTFVLPPEQEEMNAFSYALSKTDRRWEDLSQAANSSNMQAIVDQFFTPVRSFPQDGDLAIYKTTDLVKTASGIEIGPNQIVHAGVFRNSVPNWRSPQGGTIESKWSMIANPYAFEHDFFYLPDYYGNRVFFFRSNEEPLSNVTFLAHDPRATVPEPSGPLSGTTALILQAVHDADGVFHPSKGFYQKTLLELRNAGCKIQVEMIEKTQDYDSKISTVPDHSLFLVWVRAHGAPKKMKVSSSCFLNAEDVQEVFYRLPAKLTSRSIIYLDSCLTGCLKDDFYNNMQFAFGKLTAHMPNVAIFAPMDNLFMGLLKLEGSGFGFEATSSPYKMHESIAVILQQETKRVLLNAMANGTPLSDLSEKLMASLQKPQFTGELQFLFNDIKDCSCRIDRFLMVAINNCDVKKVQYIVEKLGADVNGEKCELQPIYFAEWYSPLSAAITVGQGQIVSYLLQKGANLEDTWQGKTPQVYALERGQHEIAHLLATFIPK